MVAKTKRKALPHQADLLKRYRGRTELALFWKMRLGKTLTTVRWASQFRTLNLVVAPLQCLETWQQELSKEGKRSTILHGGNRIGLLKTGLDSGHKWFLVNYEGLRKHGAIGRRSSAFASELTEFQWPTVILDESLVIQNPQAKITKVLLEEVAPFSNNRAVLCGEPNPESPLQLFNQLAFVYGSFMDCRTYWQFRNEYFEQIGYDWRSKPGTRESIREELERVAEFLSLRDVGLGNRRVHEKVYVSLPQKIDKQLKTTKRKYALGSVETKWAMVVYNWLVQIAGGCFKLAEAELDTRHDAKLDQLKHLLSTDLRNQQVVIWCYFRSEAKTISSMLQNLAIKHKVVTGSTSVGLRNRAIKKFKAGRARVLVMSLALGYMGLDLSRATAAVYFSKGTGSANYYRQSLERLEHPERDTPILYVHLIARGTLDEKIHRALSLKKFISESVKRDMVKRWFNSEDNHG